MRNWQRQMLFHPIYYSSWRASVDCCHISASGRDSNCRHAQPGISWLAVAVRTPMRGFTMSHAVSGCCSAEADQTSTKFYSRVRIPDTCCVILRGSDHSSGITEMADHETDTDSSKLKILSMHGTAIASTEAVCQQYSSGLLWSSPEVVCEAPISPGCKS